MFCIVLGMMFLAYLLNGKLFEKVSSDQFQNHAMMVFNICLSFLLTIFVIALIIRQLNHQHQEYFSLVEQINSDKITIKNSLEEKEILLSEIQHRVKNNLSIIIGLFNMQLEKSENEDYKNLLNEAKNRVLSIAMVHQKIYKKDDLSKINLSSYVSDLVQEIVKSHSLKDSVLVYEDLNNINANLSTAVPVGLIVNEVITNSLKHAFNQSKTDCTLKISLAIFFDKLILKIQDNGIGFPKNNNFQTKNIGLSLIDALSVQLDGKVVFRNENGAVVELAIPIED